MLTQLAIGLVVDRVMVGGEKVEELDGESPLFGQVAAVPGGDEAGDVLVRDGVVLPRLTAGLALAELGAADAQQLRDATAEKGVLPVALPRHVDHHDL